MNFLIRRLLTWLAGRLDGYKTLIGGAGLILGGLAGLLGYLAPDQGLPHMEIVDAIEMISLGMIAIGIAGKAEKIKAQLPPSP